MKRVKKTRLLIVLSVFLLLFFAFSTQPSAEEKSETMPEEKQETIKTDTDDINKYIIESETGVYYVVQKGDTLWDLSRQFSDSPWVWPDLWKENKQITNPHLIYPGEKIRLFRKKDIDELTKSKEEPKKQEIVKAEPVKEAEKPYYFYSAIDSIGFIKKKAIKPSGYIFKVKEDKVMISFGDLIYVRPHKMASLDPGNKYTLYRTITPIKSAKTRKFSGIQYYLTGVIEIIKKEEKFSVAKVVQSFRTIQTDDLLMPYEKRDPKIYLTGSKQDVKGKVIVSEERTEYFGEDFIAFIDKGSEDGVKTGQFYTVYYQDKERIQQKSGLFTRSRKTDLTPVDFAKLLVLHTEKETSTVLVTDSEMSIYPGAVFRAAEE